MRIPFLGLLVSGLLLADTAPPVFVTIDSTPSVTMKAGATAEALVKLTVTPGFHIQANPASQPQLIATKVELTESADIKPGAAIYPVGKPYRLAGANADIATYDGSVEIKVPLTSKASAKVGKYSLNGLVRFQACNDKTCFFPTKISFAVPVTIEK